MWIGSSNQRERLWCLVSLFRLIILCIRPSFGGFKGCVHHFAFAQLHAASRSFCNFSSKKWHRIVHTHTDSYTPTEEIHSHQLSYIGRSRVLQEVAMTALLNNMPLLENQYVISEE